MFLDDDVWGILCIFSPKSRVLVTALLHLLLSRYSHCKLSFGIHQNNRKSIAHPGLLLIYMHLLKRISNHIWMSSKMDLWEHFVDLKKKKRISLLHLLNMIRFQSDIWTWPSEGLGFKMISGVLLDAELWPSILSCGLILASLFHKLHDIVEVCTHASCWNMTKVKDLFPMISPWNDYRVQLLLLGFKVISYFASAVFTFRIHFDIRHDSGRFYSQDNGFVFLLHPWYHSACQKDVHSGLSLSIFHLKLKHFQNVL